MKLKFVISFALLSLVYNMAFALSVTHAQPCSANTPAGQVCYVQNLQAIHAAQFNYGQQYVNGWAATHEKMSPAQYQKVLNKIFFPVVISPDQKIYLEDGHHRLMASQEIAQKDHYTFKYYLKVTKRFPADNSTQALQNFWQWMQKTNNVWLKDLGVPKTAAQLPTSIEGLTNDKYRTLGGWLMEAGWCYDARQENKVNYIEFYWADYFRNLAAQGKIKDYPDPNPTTAAGLQAKASYLAYIKQTGLCHAAAAKQLPAYCAKDQGCSG